MVQVGSTREAVRRPAPGPDPAARLDRDHLGTGRTLLASSGYVSSLVILFMDGLALATYLAWHSSWWKSLLALWVLTVLSFATASQYRPRLHLSLLDDLPILLGRWAFAASLVGLGVARLHGQQELERFALIVAGTLPIHLAARAVAYYGIRLARARRVSRSAALVVGSGMVSQTLMRTLQRKRSFGLDVAGYVDDVPITTDELEGWTYLGRVDVLPDLVRRHRIGAIIFGYGQAPDAAAVEVFRRNPFRTPTIFVVPRLFEIGRRPHAVDQIGAIPVIRLPTLSASSPRWKLKRAFDVVVSLAALMTLTPLLLLTAIAVKLDGAGPILFRQQRVGRDGRLFVCYKFRSLTPAAGTEADVCWSIDGDSRVSRLGRFIRRTSIDEIPQLLNVLRGDMTIVGPRPERPYFVERFSEDIPHYRYRHRIPTGLTGLAQVNGLRGNTSIEDRARFDNYYIENWSLWLDIKVIIRTLRQVLTHRGT